MKAATMTEAVKPTESSDPLAELVRREDDRKQLPRTRQSNTGGLKLKLVVMGQVEGHHLFWCNDQDAEIEQLLEDGWGFVERSEVQKVAGLVADDDLDSRVSKYVGTRADGSPMRAYLMKCTDELWAEVQRDNQRQADEWDGAILRGMVEPDTHRYIPAGFEPKITSGIRRTPSPPVGKRFTPKSQQEDE
jgi:hypothetical protein